MNYTFIISAVIIVILIGIQVTLNRILLELKKIRYIKENNSFNEKNVL